MRLPDPRTGTQRLQLIVLADTGAATAITLFHPGKNQAVLVVAAADLAAVEARLRPQLGTSLCVVPSRWIKDQLDGVRDHLDQRWQQWNLLQLGPQHAEDGQRGGGDQERPGHAMVGEKRPKYERGGKHADRSGIEHVLR